MKKKFHICFVTGSRAEYDRVVCLLKKFDASPDFRLSILATGAHLEARYGKTVDFILKDGFRVAARIRGGASKSDEQAIVSVIGKTTIKLSRVLKKLNPDALLLFGDRAELLAPATAAVCQKIPLIHVCGGEITEGAIDDQIRHMLTKAAHLHFAANPVFARRILQMGEEPQRVIISGSPALDMIHSQKLLSRQELEKSLSFDLSSPTALVTFHPETLGIQDVRSQMKAVLGALRQLPLRYLITYPNADAESAVIIRMLKKFAIEENRRVCLVQSLGMRRYLSALKYVRLMVGNSSSGIVEAPSFHLPAVNIGGRQAGRVFAPNVIQTDCNQTAIVRAMRRALVAKRGRYVNPYGDGKASTRIIRTTARFFKKYSRAQILHKRFVTH